MGYPAARISVAVENYNWQHQDVRTESEICIDCVGKQGRPIAYGDTIDHMDFAYLAKMTKLNVAALAGIASAPPPPDAKVEGAVSTDTTIGWAPVKGAAKYIVRWRPTDAANWNHHLSAKTNCGWTITAPGSVLANFKDKPCIEILKHIRVDDWVFGVSSVSKDGFESPVASAVPGGAFHPYIAPPKK
jgi:hypothetical protein